MICVQEGTTACQSISVPSTPPNRARGEALKPYHFVIDVVFRMRSTFMEDATMLITHPQESRGRVGVGGAMLLRETKRLKHLWSLTIESWQQSTDKPEVQHQIIT